MKSRWRILSLSAAILLLSMVGMAGASGDPSLSLKEQLGKKLFFDANLSTPKFQSCAVCHLPAAGWVGPDMKINSHGAVYEGAVHGRFGNRKPPSSAYATLSPIFHYNEDEGLFVGGNFWDGRATGENLGNPAADQALGPFLNPVEQNNPSKKVVCEKVVASQYVELWTAAWGEPISCSDMDDVEKNYDRIGLAIAAYEDSAEVNQFSSKWDYYQKGMAELTDMEERGRMLFFGPNDNDGTLAMDEGAGCSACHTFDRDSGLDSDIAFTDFTFDNIGTPKNPENPFYRMDKVYIYVEGKRVPINPDGKSWIDPGLGGFLETRHEWMGFAEENKGKQKVPTARNLDLKTHPEFVKAYTHNGFFKTLEGLVHFYNTRDIKRTCDEGMPFDATDDYTEAMALKKDCWPAPEVASNVNTEVLGNLGLSEKDEEALVAFMQTLSDGYMDPFDGKDLYDGYCMGCHGSADPADMGPAPVAPRKAVGARSCSIKGAIYGTYVFKNGVKPMQFMQGAFTDEQIMMISDYLNSFDDISGQQRYVTTCAGCHGIDAMGGRVDEEVAGEDAYDIKEAIYEERPMRFLNCLPREDVYDIGGFLEYYDDSDDSDDDKDKDED